MLRHVTSADASDEVAGLALSRPLALMLASYWASPTATTLVARYREPHRHYHDAQHLRELLERIAEVAEQFQQVRPVLYAGLYHDAIYDPRRKDNEARSAELASVELREWIDERELSVVTELILATATHGSALGQTHADVGLFLDCDAAILGANPVRYRAYAEGVRLEYGHVSKLLYRLGRANFLKSLLRRPTIFNTPYFEERYGAQARLNVRTELQGL